MTKLINQPSGYRRRQLRPIGQRDEIERDRLFSGGNRRHSPACRDVAYAGGLGVFPVRGVRGQAA